MIPNDRDSFKAYCLRSLGDGVLQINVSDEQVEDRIDEALYVYQETHVDAVEKVYLKHEITPSTMPLAVAQPLFRLGEVIVGRTSGTVARIDAAANVASNTIFFYTETIDGSFVTGETITGQVSNANAVISANTVRGDFDNKYIPLSNQVLAINKVFSPYENLGSADILFDTTAQYQMSLMGNLAMGGLVDYVVGRQYMQMMWELFHGSIAFRYLRHQNRLSIDVDWNKMFTPHRFIVAECTVVLDPTTYPAVWGDRWLQRYGAALIKKQWGSNLSKYTGIVLPGGTTLDGKTILADAVLDIKALEDELSSKYQLPIDFLMG